MTEEKQKNKDIFKWIIIGVLGFFIVFLAFSTGLFIGGAKARFTYSWAESYHKNFGGPKGGFLGNWQKTPPMPGEFMGAHGVFGQIIKIEESAVVIKSPSNEEKVVVFSEDTIINRFKEEIKINDLKVDDYIVIIGEPDDSGQIKAKFIRVMPSPKETSFKGLPQNRQGI